MVVCAIKLPQYLSQFDREHEIGYKTNATANKKQQQKTRNNEIKNKQKNGPGAPFQTVKKSSMHCVAWLDTRIT